MFNVGDKVSWGTSIGVVVSSNVETFDVKFDTGSNVTFLQSTGKFDDGSGGGLGEAAKLVSKGKVKKSVKLYRWERIGTTSTGRPFVKQTEGLYDEEHAAKVLIPEGYVKIASTERIVEI